MYNVLANIPSPRHIQATVRQTFGDEAAMPTLTKEHQVDRQFMAMLGAYRSSGGLARAQEVFNMCKSKSGTDAGLLARWIVRREVVSFDWQSAVWIPLFQFDRLGMTRQPGLAAVLAALTPVFDSWEMAVWFAQPNRYLSGSTPADALGTQGQAVLDAACADRFIAA